MGTYTHANQLRIIWE